MGWIPGVIPLKVRAITTEMKGDNLVIASYYVLAGITFYVGNYRPQKVKNVIFLPNISQTQNIHPIFFLQNKVLYFLHFFLNKKSDTFPIFFIVQFDF